MNDYCLFSVYLPTSCGADISVTSSVQLESGTGLTYTNNMDCNITFTVASPYLVLASIEVNSSWIVYRGSKTRARACVCAGACMFFVRPSVCVCLPPCPVCVCVPVWLCVYGCTYASISAAVHLCVVSFASKCLSDSDSEFAMMSFFIMIYVNSNIFNRDLNWNPKDRALALITSICTMVLTSAVVRSTLTSCAAAPSPIPLTSLQVNRWRCISSLIPPLCISASTSYLL